MGQKYVTIDADNIVQEPFDADNGNVPGDAVSISDQEFEQLQAERFNLFQYAGGVLSRRPDADDIVKSEDVERFISREVLIAFASVLVDEINTLRTAAGLQGDRTLAQLKTEIKNKL